MRTIYIDKEYKCHVSNENDEYTPIETEIFDGKCDEFIEGHRFIPYGSIWNRGGGIQICGETNFPWRKYDELLQAQRDYELYQSSEQKEALRIMGVIL